MRKHSSRNIAGLFGGVVLILLIGLAFSQSRSSQIEFPLQNEYLKDLDIHLALGAMSNYWQTTGDNLAIVAINVDERGSRRIAIVDTATLSSAVVWIPGAGVEHEHTVGALGSMDKDLHILVEFSPRTLEEKSVARRFYLSDRPLADQSVIENIERGYPFGTVRAISVRSGELHYSTLFSALLPLPPLLIN